MKTSTSLQHQTKLRYRQDAAWRYCETERKLFFMHSFQSHGSQYERLVRIAFERQGQFSFVLKASNGEIILRSEQYLRKASALRGIASVRKNSPLESRFARLVAKDGRTYFNLRAGNNQVIGTSQMYKSEESRDNGIASVMTNGPTENAKTPV